MLPEPTEPLTGPLMLGLLCNSVANCGVRCLYKYLCGLEVMHGDMSCWYSTWWSWHQQRRKLTCSVHWTSIQYIHTENWLWCCTTGTTEGHKQREICSHFSVSQIQTHTKTQKVLFEHGAFKDTVKFSRKATDDCLTGKVIPPHIHLSSSQSFTILILSKKLAYSSLWRQLCPPP